MKYVRGPGRRRGCRRRVVQSALAVATGLVLALASALAGPSALAAPPSAPPSAPPFAPLSSPVAVPAPEEVVRAWVAAVNRADAEAAIALYADDAVIEALGQQFRGKPAIARRQRTIIAPVLRPRVEIEQLTVQGEAVTVRLVGENAITRFDGRRPLRQTTTFYVRDGLIQREVGPVLDPADAAWYAEAMPRFRATGALPPLLPNTGQADPPLGTAGALTGIVGATLLVAGAVLVRRRPRYAPARRQHTASRAR